MRILTLLFSLFIISVGFCQESEVDLDSISKELVNPVGSIWSMNNFIAVNRMQGDIANESKTSVNWLLQGVTPIPLNESGLTLMNRPQLPIILNSPFPITDLDGVTTFKNYSGIGDFSILMALGKMGKTKWGMFMWGAGITMLFPTASKTQLGNGKYSTGPGGMLIGFTKKSTFGFVAQQLWSYAGNSNRNDINQSVLQFIYFFQLTNGWQLGDNPTWSFNWNAGNGNKYDIPIGFGVLKTMFIGKSLFRLGITPRYYITSYETWGNKWGVSFTITPLFKNPFDSKMKSMNNM